MHNCAFAYLLHIKQYLLTHVYLYLLTHMCMHVCAYL